MKRIISIIAISMVLAGQTSAQGVIDHPSMNLAILTSVPAPDSRISSDAIPVAMKPEKAMMQAPEVSTESKSTEKESVVNSLQEVASKLVADHAPGSTEYLRTGRAMDLTATVSTGQNAMDQQSVNVHVTYDARPVCGIMNIRVELVPVFGGIGSAVRPTISREFAQAIDNFDDDFIGQTITKLTSELAADMVSK
jgi:hypothetical protein